MNTFLEYILPTLRTCLGLILSALGAYAVTYINKKKQEISANIDDKDVKKYIQMVADTVISCVIATNQTYVEALKKDNAFTADAQKAAFDMTYKNVMSILSKDCLLFLSTFTEDVEKYIKNLIEADVNYNKKVRVE